ncbi:PDT-domain-containing protein [Pleurotus eryngii]|uniref:PDT-domain-containing protein n=1 Tax=Pleurotus eryngii TaxID=5323 RepID=A0A9P6DCI7_PLEER|nr:PDT-domain-containing protein [Pleurotus eryngii]
MPTIGVAYLGPVGTYTHQAAHQKFGPSAKYVGQDTIRDVFNSLSPTIPFGVVPQENTIFGSVIETYDQLRHSNVGKGLFVVGEVTLGVQHCLLARKGVPLSEIKNVLSHEQVGLALGQCQGFLSKHLPSARQMKMPSTAAAAEAIATSEEYETSAAICSKICTTVFPELGVLEESIQATNGIDTNSSALGNRALIRIQHSDGASTSDLLLPLSVIDLGVSRIDRRPSLCGGDPFEDMLFIEVFQRSEGSKWGDEVSDALQRVIQAGWKACLLGIWHC